MSVLACVYFQNGTLFGHESLHIGPHINFCDCVLSFIFFMCSFVMPMENHYSKVFGQASRSFVVSMVPTIHLWSLWVVVDFRPYARTNFVCAILAIFCL